MSTTIGIRHILVRPKLLLLALALAAPCYALLLIGGAFDLIVPHRLSPRAVASISISTACWTTCCAASSMSILRW